jgi:hypothetical protein
MESWTKIRGAMSPESQARLEARPKETLASMRLDKMRKARSLTR